MLLFTSKNVLMIKTQQYFFFLIKFNVPLNIISLIESSQWVGGAKGEYPGKTT